MNKRIKRYLNCFTAVVLCFALSSCLSEESQLSHQVSSTQLPPSNERLPSSSADFSLSDVPAYNGNASVIVNGNKPYFTNEELSDARTSYESYSPLDTLGRCGPAVASIGEDLMPKEPRGSIGMIKPSGWHTVRYDDLIEDKYLYNRCHLIAYELTGENSNERNLITGTRYMNVSGMLPYENETAEYIKNTGNHVLYRSTPVFEGNNLVASGVLIEAESVEDNGEGLQFCVYCYNVQPGIAIDYATGDSSRDSSYMTPSPSQQTGYIGNRNSMKFHYPWCESVTKMADHNKVSFQTRDEAISEGYTPCSICQP